MGGGRHAVWPRVDIHDKLQFRAELCFFTCREFRTAQRDPLIKVDCLGGQRGACSGSSLPKQKQLHAMSGCLMLIVRT